MSDDITSNLEESGEEASRGLAGASVLMVVMTLLSAITGLGTSMALAWRFGKTLELDAYTQAFGIPDFFFFLVAGGALRTGFVPIFSQFLARGERDRAWRTFSNTLWIMLITSAVLIGLGIVVARPLTYVVASKYASPEYRPLFDLTTRLMRILFVSEIFMLLGGLLMGTLNAQKHFLWPAMGPVLYSLPTIAVILYGPREWGLLGVAVSVPIAALLCNVLLQIPPLRRSGARLMAVLDFRDEDFRRVLKLVLPVTLGLSVAEVLSLITRSMAPVVDPLNGPVVFEYANRLWKFPTRFIGAGIAIAIFAYLADNYVRGDEDSYRRNFSFGIRSTMFLTVPAALVTIILRRPIILLLFHGLSDARVAAAGDAVFWYSLGIIPLSLVYILARAFYARHDTMTAVYVGVVSVVICAAVALPLGYRMGVGGLALATSLANWANAGLLAVLLKRKVGALDGARIGQSLLRQIVPSVAFGAVCWWTMNLCIGRLGLDGALAKVVNVFAPLAAATAVFILLAWLFRVEELGSAWGLLKRKFVK